MDEKGESVLNKSLKTSTIALIFVVIQFFAGNIFSFINFEGMSHNQITIAFYILICIIPLIIILALSRDNVKETLSMRGTSIKNILMAVVITLLLMPFIAFLSYISMLFSPNAVPQELISLAQNENILLTILAVGAFPAVCEELVFRGKLFSGYREGLSLPKAVFISALLFGLVHFSLQQLMYAFVMGMVFAVMVYATKSILVSIIPHFVVNTSQILLTYFMYGGGFLENMEISQTVVFDKGEFLGLLIAAVVFLIPAILLLKKMVSRNVEKNEEIDFSGEIGEIAEEAPAEKERMFTVPFFVILGLYVYYILMR